MQQEIADAGVEVFTADPDGRKGRWGAKGRHRACAAEDLDRCFEAGFDAVLLNGVLGYGLDRSEQVDAALGAIAHLLRSGGVLVIGWDANMSDDPLATGKWRERYERDADLLGEARVGRRNGLIDPEGRPATKYFDVLRRAH
jgi:SAM-dependent methyltransferase